MGDLSFMGKVKGIISAISWRVFLWSSNMTEDQYFDQMRDQFTDDY